VRNNDIKISVVTKQTELSRWILFWNFGR